MFIWSLIKFIFQTLHNILDDDIFILLSIICILLTIRFKYRLLKITRPIIWSDAHHKIYHLDIEIGFWIFTNISLTLNELNSFIIYSDNNHHTYTISVILLRVILWRHPKNKFGVTKSKIRLNLISFRLMYDLFTNNC